MLCLLLAAKSAGCVVDKGAYCSQVQARRKLNLEVNEVLFVTFYDLCHLSWALYIITS